MLRDAFAMARGGIRGGASMGAGGLKPPLTPRTPLEVKMKEEEERRERRRKKNEPPLRDGAGFATRWHPWCLFLRWPTMWAKTS